MARINRDDVDKLYDYDLYIPSRTIYMGSVSSDEDGESGVDAIMAERVIKALHLLDQKNEPITIIMNNPGGDYYHGMAIYDAIKACQSHVTIKVFGYGMSMGALILQAADTRVIAPNAKVMIHYGYTELPSNHPKINKRWVEELDKTNKDFEDILLEKMLEKNSKITREEVQKMLDFDTIFNSKETVDIGLADEVL
jgi:ATP-dependent Clp protease protease subunit